MTMIFAALLAGHFIGDVALQPAWLSIAKRRVWNGAPGLFWPHALLAHAGLHGGFVWGVTGIWWLGLAEFIAHTLTDFAKCEGKIGTLTDQALHIGAKAAWAFIAWRIAQ